jgi:tRNA(Ile)-lysidine synthase
MIKLSLQIPREVYVACSGGVDSMAVLHFLSQRKTKPKVAYMHHGTTHGEDALHFVDDYCAKHELDLTVGRLSGTKMKKESPEEFWRNNRYLFLHGLPLPVVMAHHLDDCIEQWLFSSLQGKPGVMPTRNRNVMRPFMLTKKAELVGWCQKREVPFVHDPSNTELRYARNRIRSRIVPEAMLINPGLHKTVARLVLDQYKRSQPGDT